MTQKTSLKTESDKIPKCGIVMPISAIDGCSADHWTEVLNIIKESVDASGFTANLVSDADDSGIIQKRIIHNLYSNDIIVCDVSGKNPNVMFELGMRLAFDKPTIIIKDDQTDYSFDTSVIEHLTYPRDLRFSRIVSFKEALKKKILATFEKATKDENYTTFLKNFGEYKVAQLIEKEVSPDKFILSAIEEIREEVSMIRRNQTPHETWFDRHLIPTKQISEKALTIVKRRIDQYLKINKLVDIASNNEGLIYFLEQHSDVKETCGSQEMIRRVASEILDPF